MDASSQGCAQLLLLVEQCSHVPCKPAPGVLIFTDEAWLTTPCPSTPPCSQTLCLPLWRPGLLPSQDGQEEPCSITPSKQPALGKAHLPYPSLPMICCLGSLAKAPE